MSRPAILSKSDKAKFNWTLDSFELTGKRSEGIQMVDRSRTRQRIRSTCRAQVGESPTLGTRSLAAKTELLPPDPRNLTK